MHIISSCKEPGLFTFTFDDGVSKNFARLLDVLAAEKIKATMFIVGETLGPKNSALLNEARKAGHIIGNHTWSHPNITKISAEQLAKEIDDTDAAFYKAMDGAPRVKYFRPPYGAINQAAYDVLAGKGYKVFLWNLDKNDWNVKIPKDELLQSYGEFFAHADAKTHSYISLQHDMRINSVEIVPEIARMARGRGLKIVGMDEAI